MPEALHMARGHPSELVRVQRGEVGQGITLEVGPEDLDGVELRGVRRQQDGEPLAVMQVGGDHLSAMPGQAIPDEHERPPQRTRQRAQEGDQPRRGDVLVGAQGEVQTGAMPAGRQGEGRDDGHLVAGAAALIQDRRLAAGRPAAADDRGQQQAALVDEHEGGVQAPRFFLIRGHSTFTHRWMAASSRSRARRSGFWGLHPRARSTRPTWSTW